jgi:hypothetical protein
MPKVTRGPRSQKRSVMGAVILIAPSKLRGIPSCPVAFPGMADRSLPCQQPCGRSGVRIEMSIFGFRLGGRSPQRTRQREEIVA